MASPFTFDKTKPGIGDALNAFPAFAQAQWAAIQQVLGTLVPLGAPTTGWRVQQNANIVYLASNATLASVGPEVWNRDDVSLASWIIIMDPAGFLQVSHAAAGANPITWVPFIQLRNDATAFRPGVDVATSLGEPAFGFTKIYLRGTGGVVRYDDTTIMGVTYKKGTQNGTDYSTSSTTYVDVDAANLGMTVTIPVGWKLAVRAYFVQYNPSVTYNNFRIVDGTTAIAESYVTMAAAYYTTVAMEAVVLGDGASHTIKLQFAAVAGTAKISNQAASTTTTPTLGFPTMIFELLPSN